jgi:hypothetical protein
VDSTDGTQTIVVGLADLAEDGLAYDHGEPKNHRLKC